jgi:hypothetical protein
MVLGEVNCIISDLDTKSGNMATSYNLKLILENIIDTLNVVDTFRYKYPNRKSYTFTNKDFIKADLHVDKFSMDIQNSILYNVKFKYYPYVYAYTHTIWSCRHNLQGDILHRLISIYFSYEILFKKYYNV